MAPHPFIVILGLLCLQAHTCDSLHETLANASTIRSLNSARTWWSSSLKTLRSPCEQTKLACQKAHEQVNPARWLVTQGYTRDRKAMLDHSAPNEPPLTIATGMNPGETRGRHTKLRPNQVLLLNPPCLKPLDVEVFRYTESTPQASPVYLNTWIKITQVCDSYFKVSKIHSMYVCVNTYTHTHIYEHLIFEQEQGI